MDSCYIPLLIQWYSDQPAHFPFRLIFHPLVMTGSSDQSQQSFRFSLFCRIWLFFIYVSRKISNLKIMTWIWVKISQEHITFLMQWQRRNEMTAADFSLRWNQIKFFLWIGSLLLCASLECLNPELNKFQNTGPWFNAERQHTHFIVVFSLLSKKIEEMLT